MSHCFWSVRTARSLLLCSAGGLVALAVGLLPASKVFAQAGSKLATKAGEKADKAADKGTDKGAADDDTAPPQQQQLDAKLLIGDAVDDADSPQYRAVTSAIDKFRNRKVKEARDLLVEARTTHPQLPPAEVLMAKLYIVAQQPQLALTELDQAVRRSPKDPEAFLMLADGSLTERRVTAAEALYEKADAKVKAFTENPKRKENFEKRVLHGLAAVAESRQQWSAAEALLNQLIKLDPKNAGAYQRLGVALFQQATPQNKKLGPAYDAFAAAVKADPKAIKPDIAMGQLFEKAAQEAQDASEKQKFEDNRKKAKESFERATKPPAADLNSLLAAATWALQTNQLRLAQQYADAAMKMDPNSMEAKQVAALVARFSGDLAGAERYLNDAFIQNPGNFAITNQLALVLIEAQTASKRKRALELARINAERFERNAEAASTLGWVLYKLGQTDEAGQLLKQVINSGQISQDAAYYVGFILSKQGRNADAMQILQQALANGQPFANRMNAANLLGDLRKKVESGVADDARDDAKDDKSGGDSGKRDTGEKSGTKSKGSK